MANHSKGGEMNSSNQKHIVATGKMSNLVGLYGMIFDPHGSDALLMTFFVYGKVDDERYLIQAYNHVWKWFTNIRIVHVSEMDRWEFFENKEAFDFYYEYWQKQNEEEGQYENPFKWPTDNPKKK